MTYSSSDAVRATLDRLITERGSSYAAISAILGRNPAYIQQFIRRGSPQYLAERDRRILAQFFGVDETILGAFDPPGAAPSPPLAAGTRRNLTAGGMRRIARLAVGASAGPGALVENETRLGDIAFEEDWLRRHGLSAAQLSMIQVEGDSMEPSLRDGDDILVHIAPPDGARDGIYVLRMDGTLMVKRVTFLPGAKLSVTSDNALYPSYPDLDGDTVDIVGRVVWAGRRL